MEQSNVKDTANKVFSIESSEDGKVYFVANILDPAGNIVITKRAFESMEHLQEGMHSVKEQIEQGLNEKINQVSSISLELEEMKFDLKQINNILNSK